MGLRMCGRCHQACAGDPPDLPASKKPSLQSAGVGIHSIRTRPPSSAATSSGVPKRGRSVASAGPKSSSCQAGSAAWPKVTTTTEPRPIRS